MNNKPETHMRSIRKRNTSKPLSIESHSLTLIHRDGSQTPVGRGGDPAFEQFRVWTEARDALAEMVRMVGGVEELYAVTVTTTQARDSKLLVLRTCTYKRDEVAAMIDVLSIPGGELINTGGNCKAIFVDLPDNKYLLVTDAGDGGHPPGAGAQFVDAGIYQRDEWEPIEMHEAMPTAELLARLPEWTGR
jgi:hypothetical protein